jgi:hypothetical protein
MEDEKKPGSHLRLAAHNPQMSRERVFAEQGVRRALKELAANLMRVSRGAGKPYAIAEQCVDVVTSFRAYHEAFGSWPADHDVAAILDSSSPQSRDFSLPHDERQFTIDLMVSGALRLAAARLLSQKLQESHGEKELLEGVRAYEREREERRQKWQAQFAAQNAKLRVRLETHAELASRRVSSRTEAA